ncbi:CaiB/BaiF CoA transferase family protein [Roseivirga echinicomitans]|uniref:Carnitine dehydratase n=1 Tax=Roseivirga echinicomitans TaxID=296218 RepID=A0A150X1A6_9BACT|nr:CaiB/BaiF CoA-transferase family protein [Roseivirga echinicomitans]KYG72507.1 carnitine dehydratase [Roseivirga echinicomitans]
MKKLKIIELASVLAGPSVGQFFAELGAEVIKVESPRTGGDVTRSWRFKGEKMNGTVSAYFTSVNWGKKSLAIDLNNKEERAMLYKLIKGADIVIASYKPGDAEKLGVDYKTLKEINPALIYGQITGYGLNNPKVGYDAVIQAESGFMSINGELGAAPLKMPVALIDVLAGHQLKEAILVALIEQMESGQGKFVQVALIDAAISALVNQGANWLVGQNQPKSMGNIHPNIAPYGEIFMTKDQCHLLLAVGNDKQFSKLCKILKINEMHRFSTNQERVENRADLNRMLSDEIENWSSVELMEVLMNEQVPAGLVTTIGEALDHGESHWFLKAEGFTGLRSFAASGFDRLSLSSPPQLGQHNLEILSELD